MKRLLETIARGLVEEEDSVHVTERPGPDGLILFELEVAPEDRGSVIGRQGQTANALRTLLDAVAAETGRRAHLEIVG